MKRQEIKSILNAVFPIADDAVMAYSMRSGLTGSDGAATDPDLADLVDRLVKGGMSDVEREQACVKLLRDEHAMELLADRIRDGGTSVE